MRVLLVSLLCLGVSLAALPNLSLTVQREKILTDKYRSYIHVPKLDLNGSITSIAFKVLACNNAQITLQPSNDSIKQEPAYEVVIAGSSNSQSVIRRRIEGRNLTTHKESNLLDCQKYKSFWVSWKNGLIEVGKGLVVNNATKFMELKDSNPLPVKSVAVATGYGAEGQWIMHLPHQKITMLTPKVYSYQEVPEVDAEAARFVKFSVNASNDVHVSLQPVAGVISRDAYEIVIGGFGNFFSMIRKSLQGREVVLHRGAELDSKQQKHFWISYKQGVIRVGRGEILGLQTFMNYTDPQPLPIKALAVSTGFGSSGEFIIENPLV